jgi:hypothetical protein
MAVLQLTRIRIQQAVRFRVSGISDERIAELVGMTDSAYRAMRQLKEYKDEEQAVLTGQISKMDAALAGRPEEIKNIARQGVPAAAATLLELVAQRRDLRAALAAAKEILDRDPDKILTTSTSVGDADHSFSHEAIHGAVVDSNKVVEEMKKAAVN